MQKKEYSSLGREIVKKQGAIASHHLNVMAGDFRELFSKHFDLTQEEKNITWVLVSLFVSELKFSLLNNFADNHIGDNDIEIEEYTRLRSREYTAMLKSFFDDYDWCIPRFRLKQAISDLPPDYLFTRLFTIYKDGKSISQGV